MIFKPPPRGLVVWGSMKVSWSRRYQLYILLLVTTASAPALEVYRSQDSNGGVEYSDTPRDGTTKVEVPSPTIAPRLPVPPPRLSAPAHDAQPPLPSAQPYTKAAIETPHDGDTIHNGGGEIPVTVSSEPSLQTLLGHQVQFLLDGKISGRPVASAQFTLSAVDRGAHRLIAVIVDAHQRELIRTRPVQVFLHRSSLKFPQRQAPEKAEHK
jgi:hypothetical protein